MKRIGLLIAAIVVLLASGIWLVAGTLIEPRPQQIGTPPPGLAGESVELVLQDGKAVRGWYLEGQTDAGGILLLHGVRSNRTSMVGRAQFLNAEGYSVLLIDLQAHGESDGDRITFGHDESRGVQLAASYLKRRINGRPIGIIGSSLGGASLLLGDDGPVNAEAVILEAVYPDIRRAVSNRLGLRLGQQARRLTPLLLVQVRPRLGLEVSDLRPIDRIGSLRSPVLVIGGALDQRTTAEETESLFRKANEPKVLWVIPGAEHEDLHEYAGEEYEQRVREFFATHLQP